MPTRRGPAAAATRPLACCRLSSLSRSLRLAASTQTAADGDREQKVSGAVPRRSSTTTADGGDRCHAALHAFGATHRVICGAARTQSGGGGRAAARSLPHLSSRFARPKCASPPAGDRLLLYEFICFRLNQKITTLFLSYARFILHIFAMWRRASVFICRSVCLLALFAVTNNSRQAGRSHARAFLVDADEKLP